MTDPTAPKPHNADIISGPDPAEISKQLEAKIPGIRSVSKEDRVRMVEIVVEKTAMFSGPIPPPAVLKSYAEIDPDLVNRIVAMAESAQAHDQKVHNQIIDAEIEASSRDHQYNLNGMISARLFVLASLMLVGWLAYINQPYLAGLGLFGTSSIASIVWIFINGRNKSIPDRPPLPPPPNRPSKKKK